MVLLVLLGAPSELGLLAVMVWLPAVMSVVPLKVNDCVVAIVAGLDKVIAFEAMATIRVLAAMPVPVTFMPRKRPAVEAIDTLALPAAVVPVSGTLAAKV